MWEEWKKEQEEDMDPAFVQRDRARKSGIAVEIARTERLLIRETILEDVPRLYEIGKRPGVCEYIKPMQPTLKDETEFMDAYIHYAYVFYDYGLWTVLEQKSGEVIGRAGLFPSETLEDAVELGYMITPEKQRRGYAGECGKAILHYAGTVLDLSRVHVLADSRNTASVRTAENLGFRECERIQREKAEWIHFIKFLEFL